MVRLYACQVASEWGVEGTAVEEVVSSKRGYNGLSRKMRVPWLICSWVVKKALLDEGA